jgi:hypothetical protein
MARFWGIEKCLAIREDRLYRILTQFHFRDFCRNEFFNSHRRYHSLTLKSAESQ